MSLAAACGATNKTRTLGPKPYDKIGFTIDINFVTTMPTFNDVKQHHQSLVMSRVACEKSKLLTFFTGRIAAKRQTAGIVFTQ